MCWGARTEERHPVAPVLAPHVRVSEAIKQPSIATCMYPEFESSIFEGLFCIIKRIGLGVLRNTSLTSNHAAIFLTERLLRRSQAASCKVCTFNTSRPALMFVRDWQPLGTLFVLIPNMFLSFFINSCELWVVLPGKRAQQFYFIQFPWAAWYEYQQIICHAKKIKKVNRIDKKPFQVSLYHIHPYSTKEVIYILMTRHSMFWTWPLYVGVIFGVEFCNRCPTGIPTTKNKNQRIFPTAGARRKWLSFFNRSFLAARAQNHGCGCHVQF